MSELLRDCRGVGDPLDGRAAVVVAPARSFHVPLTDGEGRVCRLADYSERPAGAGHRAVDREYADGSLPVVRDLDDERDQRWERDVAGFLVHAAGLVVGWDAQDEASVVVCGPCVDGVLDPGSDAFAPSLGRDRDPLDHAAASFEGLRCIVHPSRREDDNLPTSGEHRQAQDRASNVGRRRYGMSAKG